MSNDKLSARSIVIKTAVTHTVTYFVVGLLAFSILDYSRLFTETALNQLMKQLTEPVVMAGPLFQPIRGLLFGMVIYLLRDVIFSRKNGWLVLWTAFIVIGILGTFGPSPGSIEGAIYTVIPLRVQLIGIPEVLLQSLLLSFLVVHWVNHPKRRWLNWSMGLAFSGSLLLPTLGLLTA